MPLRLEVGPRDFEARQVTVARRDSPPGTKGVGMPVDGLGPKIAELLEQFQADLFNTAKKARDDKLVQVWEWKDFVPALNQNCIVLTPFCNEIEWEEQVKTKSRDEYLNGEAEDERTATSVAAKTLCIPFKQVCRRATAMRRGGCCPLPLPSLRYFWLGTTLTHVALIPLLARSPTCPRARRASSAESPRRAGCCGADRIRQDRRSRPCRRVAFGVFLSPTHTGGAPSCVRIPSSCAIHGACRYEK